MQARWKNQSSSLGLFGKFAYMPYALQTFRNTSVKSALPASASTALTIYVLLIASLINFSKTVFAKHAERTVKRVVIIVITV